MSYPKAPRPILVSSVISLSSISDRYSIFLHPSKHLSHGYSLFLNRYLLLCQARMNNEERMFSLACHQHNTIYIPVCTTTTTTSIPSIDKNNHHRKVVLFVLGKTIGIPRLTHVSIVIITYTHSLTHTHTHRFIRTLERSTRSSSLSIAFLVHHS